MKKIIYLAAPYSHELEAVRNVRYTIATEAASILTDAGYLVFSPITHAHHIAGQNKGWDFWQQLDIPILQVCDLLIVLKLGDWEISKGVDGEIAAAERFNITQMFIEQEEIPQIADLVASWDYLGQFK